MRFTELTQADQVVKTGLVGLGMGMEHLQYMVGVGGFAITALCDVDARRLDRAQASLRSHGQPEAKVFRDFRQLMEAHVCEALVLSLPIPLNARFAWEALDAGYHVLSEKPIATNLNDAARLQQAVTRAGKVYQVGFELRHSPLIQTMLRDIQHGYIGRVYGINYIYARKANHSYRSWFKDGEGGSILFDCLSHTFDLFNVFAGGRLEQVFAQCAKESQSLPDDPDIGAIVMKYNNGIHGSLMFCEFCGQPCCSTMQIIGDDGKIWVDFTDAGNITMFWGKGQHKTLTTINPTSTCPGHLGIGEEHIEFRNAIVERRQPYADIEVGLDSLFLSVGSTRSAKENRPVTRQELIEAMKGGVV